MQEEWIIAIHDELEDKGFTEPDVSDILKVIERHYRAATITEHDLRTCPAMRALERLTPGGSEYIDDIDRCVEAVRESRRMMMDAMVKIKARAATKAETCPTCGSDDPKRHNVGECTCPKNKKWTTADHHTQACFCTNPWHSPAPSEAK